MSTFILFSVHPEARASLQTTMALHISTRQAYEDKVLVEEKSSARILTLNRPGQLNVLSLQMISRLLELFIAYEEDSNVKLIIIKVSILNGIVMGGGVGASIHGRFWVATENTVFAMPETALGLFPDQGASYFLSRLPGCFGEYVGLTGARLNGAEMLACGLATHFVPSVKLSLLEEALCKVDPSDPAIISEVIDEYLKKPYLKEKTSYRRLDVINRCFSQRTVEEILSALETEALNMKDSLISLTIQSMKRASPVSLKISLRSIRQGRFQYLGQCLVREYRTVCHIIQGKVSRDFYEGYRAILLEKDKNPKWEPSRLEFVTDDMVELYFSMVDDEEWEDFKLPKRSKLLLSAIPKL